MRRSHAHQDSGRFSFSPSNSWNFSAGLIAGDVHADIRTAIDTRNLRANPLVDGYKPFKELITGPEKRTFGIPGQTFGEELDGRPKGAKKWMPPTMSPTEETVSPGTLYSPDPVGVYPITALLKKNRKQDLSTIQWIQSANCIPRPTEKQLTYQMHYMQGTTSWTTIQWWYP